MKLSPFSGLNLSEQAAPLSNGVDQRLFAPTSETTQQRDNEPTPAPQNVATQERNNVPNNGAPKQQNNAREHEPTNGATKPHANEPTSQRAPVPTEERRVERHSHDIYHDQIQWLNRTKLDIEERHGVKVTNNAIVAFALDLIRDDYLCNGEDSRLMRVLVDGERWNGLREPGEEGQP